MTATPKTFHLLINFCRDCKHYPKCKDTIERQTLVYLMAERIIEVLKNDSYISMEIECTFKDDYDEQERMVNSISKPIKDFIHTLNDKEN